MKVVSIAAGTTEIAAWSGLSFLDRSCPDMSNLIIRSGTHGGGVGGCLAHSGEKGRAVKQAGSR